MPVLQVFLFQNLQSLDALMLLALFAEGESGLESMYLNISNSQYP
jgi:hypothetical protein